MSERRDNRRTERRSDAGPIRTVLGATFGPFGAAVGNVVDADRVAVTVSIGTNVDGEAAANGAADGLADAATVEIEKPTAGANEANAEDGETEKSGDEAA